MTKTGENQYESEERVAKKDAFEPFGIGFLIFLLAIRKTILIKGFGICGCVNNLMIMMTILY